MGQGSVRARRLRRAGSRVITLLVDEDVPMVPLAESLAVVGLTMSNIDGWTFRVHRIETIAVVIDLAARRRQNAAIDRDIRRGMKTLFGPPTDPGAA